MEERLDKLIATSTSALQVLDDVRALLADAKRGGRGGGMPKMPKDSKEQGPLAMLGQFAGKLGAMVTAALAFIALPPLMTAAVLPFVRALNPGLVAQFDQMLSNLQATIGYGLEPIIVQATQTLREWSGMLLPTLRQLRPVVAEV